RIFITGQIQLFQVLWNLIRSMARQRNQESEIRLFQLFRMVNGSLEEIFIVHSHADFLIIRKIRLAEEVIKADILIEIITIPEILLIGMHSCRIIPGVSQ